MPPNNVKKISRTAANKEKHNARVTLSVMDTDGEAIFGKAVKALGNKRFRVVVPDMKGSLRETDARIGGKNVIRIEINDIVVVVQSGRDLEIMGRMDKKNTARLQKENRIHPALLTAGQLRADVEECGFEFDYEGGEEAPAPAPAAIKGSKTAKVEAHDDDVDIDAI